MILWLCSILLVAGAAVVGYYQGAIRVAISLIALLLGALLALPLSPVVRPVLPIFGLHHPVLLDFIAPLVVFLLVLIVFKTGAQFLHRKVETYYKYQSTDTQRLLWERMNQRVGICLGVANGVIYVYLICAVAYLLGYFTTQVSAAEQEKFLVRGSRTFAENVQDTGMVKAVSPFLPRNEEYYDAVDILGDIYHNPVLQARLGRYPVFLSLAEKPEFKDLGNNLEFQNFWIRQPRPTLAELLNHDKIKPLVNNVELFTNVLAMIRPDLKDLKTYVETGKSPKYDEEKILGRWEFDLRESFARAKKAKPNLTLADIRKARKSLSEVGNASLVATIDGRVSFKIGAGKNVQNVQGTWKPDGTGDYVLRFSAGGTKMELPASIETSKLVVTRDAYALVFEK